MNKDVDKEIEIYQILSEKFSSNEAIKILEFIKAYSVNSEMNTDESALGFNIGTLELKVSALPNRKDFSMLRTDIMKWITLTTIVSSSLIAFVVILFSKL